MIDKKEMTAKNVNLAMVTKETPALDLTRKFVGYTPRSNFKQHYMRSLKKSNTELLEHLSKNYRYDKPTKIIPYLYDARRRGLDIPDSVEKHYNIPDERYMRALNVISGVPAEKYVNTSMSMAGSLTGYAVLDWLQDRIMAKNKASKAGWEAAASGPGKVYSKVLGKNLGPRYQKVTEHSLSAVIGKYNPKTSRLLERIIGSAHSIPTLGLAALPLVSRRVLKPLKGKDEESKRYKTFDWIEKNPGKTMGIAYTPAIAASLIGGGYDVGATVRNIGKGKGMGTYAKGISGSLGRTGITLGKLGLTAAIPLMFIQMRRNMTNAREEEQSLINKKIIKNNITQGSKKQ